MVRKGIYVNGKEIVARYFGVKLVWKKETEKFWLSLPVSGVWTTVPSNRLASQVTEYTSYDTKRESVEVTISKVIVKGRSWEAAKFGLFYTHLYGDKYQEQTRITFKNSQDKIQFQQFMNSQPSTVTINLYRKE